MSDTHNIKVALIGNPNCGKTTLFNCLTGAHQNVGNWPGVTVEKKTGFFRLADGCIVELIDLPGIYSLEQEQNGLDELIAANFLEQQQVDIILNIVDASCLDRQLLLTHQLRDKKIPMLVAVNMLDVAKNNNIRVDTAALAEVSGLPVVGIIASETDSANVVKAHLNEATNPLLAENYPNGLASKMILRIKDTRHWVNQSVKQNCDSITLTERIDQFILHPLVGFPFFLLMMYLLFTFAINVGSIFIDFFDILLGAWLVDGLTLLLQQLSFPEVFVVLLADGLGGGIQLVGTFIPVIGFLYFGLSLLESSGYISRAAFVVDRLMRVIGLPGRSFVPLIVGFGCNVPSVMATRSLSKESDRLVTMAMTPFMSCGARLTVYALFAAAFFPSHGQNIVFSLYLLGIVLAVATGWVFRKSFFNERLTSSIMEMPAYHMPNLRNVFFNTWHRLKGFCTRAGKTIVIVVVALSFLNSWGTDGSFGNQDKQNSLLSELGRVATPLLSPFGVEQDNWPATVGVVTGIFAKEAVVGTLDSLYADVSGVQSTEDEEMSLSSATVAAFMSIVDNAQGLADSLTNPLGIMITEYNETGAAAAEQGVRLETFTTMTSLFASSFAAYCYLVFILLYTPCVAVIGALVREAGTRWAWMIALWSTVLAYATATILYQLGTIFSHPLSSLGWVTVMLGVLGLSVLLLKHFAQSQSQLDRLIPVTEV
jgi:ferrous iron transport protein B